MDDVSVGLLQNIRYDTLNNVQPIYYNMYLLIPIPEYNIHFSQYYNQLKYIMHISMGIHNMVS